MCICVSAFCFIYVIDFIFRFCCCLSLCVVVLYWFVLLLLSCRGVRMLEVGEEEVVVDRGDVGDQSFVVLCGSLYVMTEENTVLSILNQGASLLFSCLFFEFHFHFTSFAFLCATFH